MDEQLEVAFEGTGVESQSETPVSPGSEAGTAEEKAEEALRQEEVNEFSTQGETFPPAGEKPSPGGEGGPLAVDEVSPPAGDVPPRNYYAEWQELAEAHPEVVGKELPEDIYQECMRSELPPLRVYESMMLQKQAEQISALQQEIATLRQNAENTARAPVSAAADSPENGPDDLFVKGLYSY